MADAGGYWLNLAEAQKLTQDFLVPGVIETQIRRGGLLARLPIAQYTGLKATWNRENAERLGRNAAIGDQLTWTDNVTHTQVNAELKTVYDQTPLNKYVQEIYGNYNNYKAVALTGLRKGLVRQLEDQIFYGDATYGTNQFDGLHAWAEDNGNTFANLDIDEGEGALSLANVRVLLNEMKAGVDFIVIAPEIGLRLDAYYQEVGSSVSNRSAVGILNWTIDEAGKKVTMFDGVPIIRSDYLVAEQANTGVGSDARAKRSSGTNMYSMFAVKMGPVLEGDPGLTLAFGGANRGLGEFFKLVVFDNLENYDAEGLRLVSYAAVLAGGVHSVGRIYDITDVVVTL